METYSLVVRWVPSLIEVVNTSRAPIEKIIPNAQDHRTSQSRLVQGHGTVLRIIRERRKMEGGHALTQQRLRSRSLNDIARD